MCGWEVEKGSPDNPDTWERASGKGSEFGPFNDASNNPGEQKVCAHKTLPVHSMEYQLKISCKLSLLEWISNKKSFNFATCTNFQLVYNIYRKFPK